MKGNLRLASRPWICPEDMIVSRKISFLYNVITTEKKSYFILNVVVITFSGPNAKTDEPS